MLPFKLLVLPIIENLVQKTRSSDFARKTAASQHDSMKVIQINTNDYDKLIKHVTNVVVELCMHEFKHAGLNAKRSQL